MNYGTWFHVFSLENNVSFLLDFLHFTVALIISIHLYVFDVHLMLISEVVQLDITFVHWFPLNSKHALLTAILV